MYVYTLHAHKRMNMNTNTDTNRDTNTQTTGQRSLEVMSSHVELVSFVVYVERDPRVALSCHKARGAVITLKFPVTQSPTLGWAWQFGSVIH